ncbi:MAG: CHAT domain-containing protein [Planctomycetes bacterium]|nr:CHAT domain-containing protein [Planctomycetota bacterium]
MTLLDAVRRESRRRGSRPEVAAPGPFPSDSWKSAEQAVLADVRTSPKRAVALVDAFERLARADGSAEARGRAARLRGSWLSTVARDREALAPYREAIRRLDGPARDGARLGLAASLTRTGRFADALAECVAVRRNAVRRDDRLFVGAADMNEGVARHESGDAARAAKCYRRARTAFAAAGQPTMAAQATQNLANALVLLESFDEAETLYAEASDALDGAGLSADAAACRVNLAGLLALTDRLGHADALLRRAETDLRAAGLPVQAALARRDRGDVLLRAGLVPEARHALDTASRALRVGAPPVESARSALFAARAALAEGDADAGRRGLRSADTGLLDVAEIAEIRGRADAVRGRLGSSQRMLVDAAKRFGATRPAGRARCLAAASWCAEASGDFVAATRLAKSAEAAAVALPMPSVRFAASAARFLAAAASGHRADADAALVRTTDALESMRAGLRPETMRAALLRGREAWLARAVRHLLAGADGPRRALAFIERWRARSLVDRLSSVGDDQAPDATSGDGAALASLRREVARLENRAEGSPTPGFLRAPLLAAPTLVRRLRAAERDLLDALRRDDAPDTRPFTDADLAAVRAALPADTLVVAPVEDGERAWLLVADRRSVRAIASPVSPADVRDAAAALHHALGAWTLGTAYVGRHEMRLRRGVDAALAKLAAAFVAPLADDIARATHLVIVPSGPWHHVPLGALPWQGKPLIARLPVTSVPALAALRDPPRAATGGPVVVSVPDESAPAARIEGEAVARTLGATLLAGDDATAGALAALDGPSCLHVAAHGRHRPDAPESSGVRLADGWFRAAEFARLHLRGSIVVLSGCETGLAAVQAGDEAIGLVRGAFAAGAADVVASLWRVDDAATSAFMQRLHALRAAGTPCSAALATTQRELAASGAPPWHWAAFVHHARHLD